jgi:carboxypeptidase C (cathepsin A)
VKAARTFVFNGGPGSASIWLHFGLWSKLIDIPSDASDPGAPPYRLRDNPWTILRATDLVMVDPVGTGYSKALGEKKNEEFCGYTEDADSVAEFIRTFSRRRTGGVAEVHPGQAMAASVASRAAAPAAAQRRRTGHSRLAGST